MSEREMPDIPQHLLDSMTGAEHYEIEARRQYQIEMMRWRMGITPEHFARSDTIQRYVSVRRDTEAMADRLRWPELQAVMSSGTPVFAQLRQAGLLYMVARTILTEGFEGASPSGRLA